MSFKSTLLVAAATLSFASPALACSHLITVEDPFARSSTAMAVSGAAFMTLINNGSEDDRLIAASSDIAKRIELHTHIESAEGVMRMVHVEEGFVIPAGGSHALARGGDHVMFMGLTKPLAQGDMISLTLTFEQAGDVMVEVPVDLIRKPKHGMKHKSSG